MSDTDDNPEHGSQEPPADPNTRASAALRVVQKERDEAQAEALSARKELAFSKAGISTESGVGALLAKTYEGEPTAEGIKAYADSIGITLDAPAAAQVESGNGQGQSWQSELEAQRRITQAGATGSAPSGLPRLEDAIAAAKDRDELMAVLARAPQDAFRVDRQSR